MSANKQIQKLLADYERVARTIRLRLLAYYPSKLVWGLIGETRQELAGLIPEIPDIGEHHVWQSSLEIGVMSLALHRVLKKNDYLMDEAARMTGDIFQVYFQSLPKPLRWTYCWYFFSVLYKHDLRECARRSQLRLYPGDWLFTYVEGDGKAFDVGVDIQECAILKFYQAQKAEGLIPSICQFDDTIGRMLGLGLNRTGTLASGSDRCDCRWKYDRKNRILLLPQVLHLA